MSVRFTIAMTVVLTACLAGGDAGTGSAASAPKPPAAGVRGVVKVQGAIPKPTRIDMSADPKCPQSNPGGGMTDDIVADSSGGLEDVIVYISQGLVDAKFEP